MTAKIAEVANAVVDVLNGEQFSLPFTATRTYLPAFDLTEMKDLHVTVVPRRETSQAGDPARSQFEYEIDVAVQQKLAAAEQTLAEGIAWVIAKADGLDPEAVIGNVREDYARQQRSQEARRLRSLPPSSQ